MLQKKKQHFSRCETPYGFHGMSRDQPWSAPWYGDGERWWRKNIQWLREICGGSLKSIIFVAEHQHVSSHVSSLIYGIAGEYMSYPTENKDFVVTWFSLMPKQQLPIGVEWNPDIFPVFHGANGKKNYHEKNPSKLPHLHITILPLPWYYHITKRPTTVSASYPSACRIHGHSCPSEISM